MIKKYTNPVEQTEDLSMTKFGFVAVAMTALSLAACAQDGGPSTSAPAQSLKAEAVQTAQATGPFAAVEGMICRGYYKQSEGGQGSLTRPESAFKTTHIKNGHFTMTAANARPGASDGWQTASGNSYLRQGDTEFKVQPNGAWFFLNPIAGSKYFLTAVDLSGPVKFFSVRYEADSGWAPGHAECRDK